MFLNRCLTNGEEYSKKEEQAIIDKRVRGGQQTVDALYELKKKGISNISLCWNL